MTDSLTTFLFTSQTSERPQAKHNLIKPSEPIYAEEEDGYLPLDSEDHLLPDISIYYKFLYWKNHLGDNALEISHQRARDSFAKLPQPASQEAEDLWKSFLNYYQQMYATQQEDKDAISAILHRHQLQDNLFPPSIVKAWFEDERARDHLTLKKFATYAKKELQKQDDPPIKKQQRLWYESLIKKTILTASEITFSEKEQHYQKETLKAMHYLHIRSPIQKMAYLQQLTPAQQQRLLDVEQEKADWQELFEQALHAVKEQLRQNQGNNLPQEELRAIAAAYFSQKQLPRALRLLGIALQEQNRP